MESSNYTEVKFFSQGELKQLLSLENQQVKKVNYYYWINKAKSNEEVEFLDKIEFTFIDNEIFCISVSELMDSLEVISFDLHEINKDLFDKFDGDVYLKMQDATDDAIWNNVLEYEINEVQLEMNNQREYFSDKILLSFGPQKRLISLTPNGLLVTNENK